MKSTHGSVPLKHRVVRLYIGISPMITSMKSKQERVPCNHNVVRLYIGISPMITSMKSTQERVPCNHSLVRLYIGISPMITPMKSTQKRVPFNHSVVRLLYRYISHDNIHEINTWKCPMQSQLTWADTFLTSRLCLVTIRDKSTFVIPAYIWFNTSTWTVTLAISHTPSHFRLRGWGQSPVQLLTRLNDFPGKYAGVGLNCFGWITASLCRTVH